MTTCTGFAMRSQNRPLAGVAGWDCVEIDFRRAAHPLRTAAYLADMDFDYVSLHTLELSLASPEAPCPRLVDQLLRIADENRAVAITDHLGFAHATRGAARIGHVIAPPCTQAALDATSRNVERLQRAFGWRPLYIENLAHFFQFQGEMQEAEFIQQLLQRTGCGLLLDVTNAYANQLNFGNLAGEFIEQIVPAASSLQMHLAGGVWDDGTTRYVDSHSEPIPLPVWELYDYALRLSGQRCRAVFIERDWNFPDQRGWCRELERARRPLSQSKTAKECA